MKESSSNDELRLQELRSIGETISTLHQLSLAIRKASNRNSLTKIPKLFDRDNDYTIIREYTENGNDLETLVKAARFEIGSTFEEFVRRVLVSRWLRPSHEAKLDEEQNRYRDTLFNRSVEAISVRRRQLAYFQSHQRKLAGGNSAKLISSTQRPTGQQLGTQLNPHLQNEHLKVLNPAQPMFYEFSDTILSETVGSELHSNTLRSAPPRSAPSPTASTNADGEFRDGGPFEVPSPPKLELEDREKACPYCYLVLPAKTFSAQKKARRWERHLLEDLQPYICLFENCNQRGKSYSLFKDWEAHLNQPHSHSWLCPLHPEEADDTDGQSFLFHKLVNFHAHLETYHSDLEIEAVDDLIHSSSQPAMLVDWCFVCFEKLPVLPMLQKHMANHFKSMSLLALPWRDDLADDEALSSDQLKSSRQPSNDIPHSVTDLGSASIFEDAESEVVSPAPTLQPEEFAHPYRKRDQPLTTEFLDFIHVNQLYAQTDAEKEERTAFVPLLDVKDYLEARQHARLRDILEELFAPNEPPVDTDTILRNYVAVFCILVEIGRGEAILSLVQLHYCTDRNLPFDSSHQPRGWPLDIQSYNYFCMK